MKHVYTWGAILAVVLASTTGDVLLSRAMKKVGDVGELWRRAGLLTVAGRILRRPSFVLGIFMMAVAFFSLLFASVLGRREPGGSRFRFPYLRGQCRGRENLPP